MWQLSLSKFAKICFLEFFLHKTQHKKSLKVKKCKHDLLAVLYKKNYYYRLAD